MKYTIGLSCAAALVLGLAAPALAQDANGCVVQYVSAGYYKISVKKDGGPCSAVLNRKGAWMTSSITSPPQHGTATVTLNGSAATFLYTPTKGYTGPDVFRGEIAATRPYPNRFDITVTP